jgi:hypothetical protein
METVVLEESRIQRSSSLLTLRTRRGAAAPKPQIRQIETRLLKYGDDPLDPKNLLLPAEGNAISLREQVPPQGRDAEGELGNAIDPISLILSIIYLAFASLLVHFPSNSHPHFRKFQNPSLTLSFTVLPFRSFRSQPPPPSSPSPPPLLSHLQPLEIEFYKFGSSKSSLII